MGQWKREKKRRGFEPNSKGEQLAPQGGFSMRGEGGG